MRLGYYCYFGSNPWDRPTFSGVTAVSISAPHLSAEVHFIVHHSQSSILFQIHLRYPFTISFQYYAIHSSLATPSWTIPRQSIYGVP